MRNLASNFVIRLDPERAKRVARMALEEGRNSTPWVHHLVTEEIDRRWAEFEATRLRVTVTEEGR